VACLETREEVVRFIMPRIGMNPSRGKKLAFKPARTTVAVLVHAPHEVGYFEYRLAVTRMTIESILQKHPRTV